MKKTNSKKRLGVLDIFIIIIVLVCVASVVIRYVGIDNSQVSSEVQLDNYILSFNIKNIKDSSANNYMEKGTKFFIQSSGEYLGTLREGVTISDAVRYYELQNGQSIAVPNTATGDLYRVDVEASLDVQGVLREDGTFLLGGNQYVAVNKEITVYSKYLTVTIMVTDITKAQ
ncbi:MAG: hypothetical protein E7672_07675 [Ruminococcaceae bacterium]|nr:hypothetical protein [Oscillospiraceae bacterium]